MTLPVKLPNFSKAPDQYDPAYLDRMFKELRLYMNLVNTKGPIEATTINASLPVSADGSGLKSGTIYTDGAGAVHVVP